MAKDCGDGAWEGDAGEGGGGSLVLLLLLLLPLLFLLPLLLQLLLPLDRRQPHHLTPNTISPLLPLLLQASIKVIEITGGHQSRAPYRAFVDSSSFYQGGFKDQSPQQWKFELTIYYFFTSLFLPYLILFLYLTLTLTLTLNLTYLFLPDLTPMHGLLPRVPSRAHSLT